MLELFLREIMGLCALCTIIYISVKIWMNKSDLSQTLVHTTQSYQTITHLFNMKIKDPNLSSDNSVYLTRFKSDGYVAYVQHSLYSIYLYFRRDLNNLYFLAITIGFLYKFLDFKSISHTITLTAFLIYFMATYIYSMSGHLRNQHRINHERVTKVVRQRGQLDNGTCVDVLIDQVILQKDLKRGDLIKLNEYDPIPADILLINSRVLVQQLALTGESLDISKVGLMVDLNYNPTEAPMIIINHHQNSGLLIQGTKNYPYTQSNMIFRGTKIVDRQALGIVIETGNDTAIYRIDQSKPKGQTLIERRMLNICLDLFYLMILMDCILGVSVYAFNLGETKSALSYRQLWNHIGQMILLFNMMVPLSLPLFFNTGCSLLSQRIAQTNQITINRHGKTGFLVDPQYIVTDKTGTITTEKMELAEVWNYQDQIQNKIPLENLSQLKFNILACTETQPHSQTHKLLKNDPLEQILLTHVCETGSPASQVTLMDNLIQDGAGQITLKYKSTGDVKTYVRHAYYPFNYNLEVKMGVIEETPKDMVEEPILYLHIQGTPEAINHYSKIPLDYNAIQTAPANAYRRIIAHARKPIRKSDLSILKENPHKLLHSFTETSLYVFYDYVVPGVDQAMTKLLSSGKNLTILTGDKMSSAIEIGTTVGLIQDLNQLIMIESLDDLNKVNLNYKPSESRVIVLNGRLLETLVSSNYMTNLVTAMSLSQRQIIYRASPNSKHEFVKFLKTWFKQEVFMIGDGPNDGSALVEANLGAAIYHSENQNIQDLAEIVLTSWTQIPKFLHDCALKRIIITDVFEFVPMKHMITAFMLAVILFMSQFEQVRDPADPWLMNGLNALTFGAVCAYCRWSNPKQMTVKANRTILGVPVMIIKGIGLGIINALGVFSILGMDQVNLGIKICVGLQAAELGIQLWSLYQP